jgi:hypothetical protein
MCCVWRVLVVVLGRLPAVLVVIALLAVGAGLAMGASSSRDRDARQARHWVSIQAVYDRSGNPSLVANFSPNGGLAKPRWFVCTPNTGRGCVPAHGSGQSLDPGRVPAGTVFEARARYRGVRYSARSALWEGTVHAVRRPELVGRVRFGGRVTARKGIWAGGWQPRPVHERPADPSGGHGPSIDALSVEACRTRAARDCVNLTAQGKFQQFSRRPAVVGAWFTGWYLFAFDQREGPDLAIAEPGEPHPSAIPPVKPGPTVAHSMPGGPIIGPPDPRSHCFTRPACTTERLRSPQCGVQPHAAYRAPCSAPMAAVPAARLLPATRS